MADEQKKPEPATPGDVLPNLILPDATGSGVGMGQQNRAGRWQVLSFVEPGELSTQSEAAAAARARLEKIEGLLHVVLIAEPNPTVVGADLFDQSAGGAAFLLGAPKGGIAVISPVGRLAATFGSGEFDKAVALCEAAYAADEPRTATRNAPVLIIPYVLEPELCARAIEHWHGAEKMSDEVANQRQGNYLPDPSIKRRTDALISNESELFADLRARITRRVLPMIDRVFRMQVASMEVLRIGRYASENQGAFGRHRDNTTQFTAHRRFAMTLNLNADDYEGGELRFPEFGRTLYKPETGSAVIFSCSLLHEALPVTSGDRFGMFTFFTDTAGLEQEKKAQRQREQQAQQAQQAQKAPVA